MKKRVQRKTYASFAPLEVWRALRATFPERVAEVPEYFTMHIDRETWVLSIMEAEE